VRSNSATSIPSRSSSSPNEEGALWRKLLLNCFSSVQFWALQRRTNIQETVTESSRSGSCSNIGNACQAGTSLKVGNQGFFGPFPADGFIEGPQLNVMWDQHDNSLSQSVVPQGQSCSIVCAQSYSCGGNPPIGNFQITYTFTGQTLGTTPVTIVSVTKQ
jgi:hypothetical protein